MSPLLKECGSGKRHVVRSIGVRTRFIDQRLFLLFPNSIAPMSTEQTQQRIPKLQFRVLIIGRANAGKTTILQRVCDTTESPKIYRQGKFWDKKVRSTKFVLYASLISLPTRSNLTRPLM